MVDSFQITDEARGWKCDEMSEIWEKIKDNIRASSTSTIA